MWLERDACGIADQEMGAIRELRLFEPLACLIDARWRKVHAGRARGTRVNEPEKQTPTPATKLEHGRAGRVEGEERISEALRDCDEALVRAFRQALGHLGVEMSRDPRIGRACALLLFRVGLQIHRVAFAVLQPDVIIRGDARRLI